MKWHGRRDDSHEPIRERLRALGASWADIADVGGGVPDGICGFCGHTFLVECKSGKKKLRPGQATFASSWRGSAIVVLRTAEEAQRWYLDTRAKLTRP